MNELKNEATLGCSQTGNITVSKLLLQDQMNLQQLIAKEEIFQDLHVVESNQSFRSTDKDFERFREQFLDSKIAAGFSMHADKTQSIIVYGTAPFVKDFIILDAKGKCFPYKFDETTISKVEKQCDVYITYFSDFFKKPLQHIVDLYLSETVLAKTYYTISTLSWTCWIYQSAGVSILAWMVQL